MKKTHWHLPLLLGLALSPILPAQEQALETPVDTGTGGAPSKDVDPFAEACELEAHPDAGLPKYVQVQVEFVEMGHKDLTKLLFLSNPEIADATPLRKTVAEMVRKGEAEVIETMMVVARAGERAASEAIREYIYPTEYEPPTIPDKVSLPGKGSGMSPEELKAMGALRTQFAPTAFETRNLGGTLEIEPMIGENGKLVDLRLAPEIVWHTGNTVWAEDKDPFGNVSKVQMPEFYKLSVTTSITCIDGQYNLIAVLSPKNQAGVTDFTRKVMLFVKCDVVVVKEMGE